MTATEKYIEKLKELKNGDLGLLRAYSGLELDEAVHGFDLFTGLWWPLRQESPRAPRRKVAWLIAKLYAFRPIEHAGNDTLPIQLRKCQFKNNLNEEKILRRFDALLSLPLDKIEPSLQWALDLIASNSLKIDWIKLTDDLSVWERIETRLKWAEQFLNYKGGK